MAAQSEGCGASEGASVNYKDVLRTIFDSEECKIHTAKAGKLKTLVENLCTVQNEGFVEQFCMVAKDVSMLKKQKKGSFKDMYKYCAEKMSCYLKGMDEDAEYNHPILWQVCTA